MPLVREISGRTGLLLPNSSPTDEYRRQIQTGLPFGASIEIADELGARRSRVSDEIEGKVLLSVDVLLAALKRLSFERRLRFFFSFLAPFRIAPCLMPGAVMGIV